MKKLIKYLVTLSIGLIIFLMIIISKDVFHQTDKQEMFKILVDGLFVPGIMIFGFGLLVVASNGGTFDMIAYGIIRLFDLFKSDVTKTKHRTFYDYRTAKSENKSEFGYLLIVGIIFIVLSLFFLILYYNTK